MTTPLKTVLLRRLMASGTWMRRAELTQGCSTSPLAIEDALADLVIDRQAVYRDDVGYRLSGTPLARQAAKTLLEKGLARAVCGRQVKDEYLVGVAEQQAELGLVMYELAMPMPASGPEFVAEHLRQVDAVIEFSTRGA